MILWKPSSCLALCLADAIFPAAGLVFAQGLGGLGEDNRRSSSNTSAIGTLNQPLFLTGRVVMLNGEPPPERVVIERSCSVSDSRAEGYTDTEGRFSLQLGTANSIVTAPSASNSGVGQPNLLQQGGDTGARLWACELRASLAGYISTTVSLAGHHSSDSPDVGYIVLRRLEKTPGLAMSATSALAPEASRRAFQDGMRAIRDRNWKSAEKSLTKAVEVYDRHAEAWYQLGRVYRQRKKPEQAREAFLQATKADPNYVYPYEGLYQLALARDDMAEVLDKAECLLRLNPYEFPLAYYYSAVANLQLQNFDAGEERIRTALALDPGNTNPMSHFVLGYLLASKGQFAEAVDALEVFLELKPGGAAAQQAQAALEKLHELLAREGSEPDATAAVARYR